MTTLEQQRIEEREAFRERYDLAINRIEMMLTEKSVKEPYYDYFIGVANFLMEIKKTVSIVETGKLKELSLETLKTINSKLYDDIARDKGHSYDFSYANPAYANNQLGEEYGQLLCFLYTELRGLIPYSFEQRFFDITIALELFIEIYNYFEEEEQNYEGVKSAIYYYISDYCDCTIPQRTGELLDPKMSFATDIIMKSDLTDLRYLYYFGEYISENELKIAQYLNELAQADVDNMARTYTEGFRMGFINNNIDLSKKSVVNIRYNIGFERMVKAAIVQFEKMGLRPTISRYGVTSINKRQNLRIGYTGTSPNKQYDYDHRFDDGIYLDKAFVDRKLDNIRVAYEKYKALAQEYAGPAVIEIFGEKDFEPINKTAANKLSKKQQKLVVDYSRDSSLIMNEYIKREETSFTIIAYPIPEIGEEFQGIFNETVKVNTLDPEKYKRIQQTIIDALDQGEYVRVIGSKKNKTNIKVMLHKLNDPPKETKFENCLADVNIPVGEVFTSPVLTGTNGILHIGEVYLNDLKYIDLALEFEDGMIKKYTCKNFKVEDENIQFVKENLMFQHKTLPLGEFAIGTNTVAYKMGKKFDIAHKLPILIAEKMGPHFAVGDTCYKMSEENRIYNPDGKEIVAKDNECSINREDRIDKAYFNCHTDITIPYDELGEIFVYTVDGAKTEIIKDGKFVLEGTYELNIPLES
jgi:aminopeptidase